MNTLIIGAAGGIGKKLVDDLIGTSNNLLLGYNNNSNNLPVESLRVDARDFESVKAFVMCGQDKFGSIDAVVSLPGSLILKPAHKCTDQEFTSTIETNLKSAFAVVRSVGELLENCSVVLMSTAAASIGLANHELIACAKAGI